MNLPDLLKEKITEKTARICVIGLGYVGLPTAVFFACEGFDVTGADIDPHKVETINKGLSPLHDLNLDADVNRITADGKFWATTDITSAVSSSDIVLIIVPTPVTESKEPDLTYVHNAAMSISAGLHRGMLIVLESTTYPGTTEEIVQPILERTGLKAGDDFGLAYCPERYNPGDPLHPLKKVSRIVGAIDEPWTEVTCHLYRQIIEESVTAVRNIKTAEAAKVIENIQRDLNIALMNELALIFERMDIDVMDVIEAASTKWNFNVFYPGPGVGGHCLPVDPYYLTKKAQEVGYHALVILAGRRVNDYMPLHILELLQDGLNEVGKPIKGANIIVFGASYKENTADLRESPTEKFVNAALSKGSKIRIVEPNIDADSVFGCENLKSPDNIDPDSIDAIIYMVNHSGFAEILSAPPALFKENIVVIDGKRQLNPEIIRKRGCIYHGVGAVNK